MSKTISIYLTDEANTVVSEYMEQFGCSLSKAVNDIISNKGGANTFSSINKYLRAIYSKVKDK